MNILVTGGAGYVGSVVVERLLADGHRVIVLDNLQQGHRQAVLPPAQLIEGDIRNQALLTWIIEQNRLDAVVHMAAETVVEHSMTDPRRYFDNNLGGGLALLDAMLQHNLKKLIFSSTAAVYGEPGTTVIEEEHPKKPVNSYGASKLMFEDVLRWYASAYGMQYMAFRYFCAAGATAQLGEHHEPETHLIPSILRAAVDRSKMLTVYGADYGTPDGSCIRDFVHVVDIADAHILALHKLDSLSGSVYNLGNSRGYSVLEVIKAVEKVTGQKIAYKIGERRPGDPAVLIAGSMKARQKLGWQPQYAELEDMLRTAWQWAQAHPEGYGQ